MALTKKQKRNLFIFLAILILIALIIYFYTYYFAKDNPKVIYEKGNRRIYLIDKKEYKKGREIWRLILEDQTDGKRTFVFGNSKKGFPNEKMAQIINNTFDKGLSRSFDNVQGAGVLMRAAKTDNNSNLIKKDSLTEIADNFKGLNLDL